MKNNNRNNEFSAPTENNEIKNFENEASEEYVAVKTIVDNINGKDQYSDDTIDYLLNAQLPKKFVELSSISLSKEENEEEMKNIGFGPKALVNETKSGSSFSRPLAL